MKILLDTNFLYSALFHPSARFNAIIEFVFTKNVALIPDYVAGELIRKSMEKRPEALSAVYEFLDHVHTTPLDEEPNQDDIPKIRDPKDQPILNAAIDNDVDIIITGDKHFHALEIEQPRIMAPAEFIREFLPYLD